MPPRIRDHELVRQQWIPRPLGEVFAFFSRAENLGEITPPWLQFRIRSPLPVAMGEGTQLDYTIRLAGIPLGWRTRIVRWEPERSFCDVQERGPYALWEHTHEFTELGDGVLMLDRVRYALPLGPLGRAVHALAVRSALAAIFDYRFAAVERQIGKPSSLDESPDPEK